LDIVKGERHAIDAIREVFDWLEGMKAARFTLLREPGNEYDPNAIRVITDGRPVGYIAREVAEELAPVMDSASVRTFDVPGVFVGYSRGSQIEIYLWLDRPLTDAPKLDVAHLSESYFPIGPHGGPPGGAIEFYWDLRDELTEAAERGDDDRVVEMSRLSMEVLPAVVDEVIETRGSSWTSVPPAVTVGAEAMLRLGDDEGLELLRTTLSSRTELEPWLADLGAVIERSRAIEGAEAAVLERVRDEPGILQTDLYAALDFDRAIVSEVCYYLAERGALVREKKGRTYMLRRSEEGSESS
jgi:hypothetical protein